MDINESVAKSIKVAALARTATGAKLSNVSISGKFVTNYTGELPKLSSAVFEDGSVIEESEFKAEITIEKQQ